MMKKWTFMLLGVIVCVVYFICDPVVCHFPKCPFLQITGMKCPGCGSQRALHSLLHLNFLQAIRYNAFLVVSIPIVAILIYSETIRTKSNLYVKIQNVYFIWTYFFLIVVWWIIRNVMGW